MRYFLKSGNFHNLFLNKSFCYEPPEEENCKTILVLEDIIISIQNTASVTCMKSNQSDWVKFGN